MKRFTIALTAIALSGAFCVAHAQSTDDQSKSAAQTNQKDPNDPSKGQDLVGQKQPKDASATKTPQTTGQNKATGNNLVGENKGQMQRSEHPDFKTIDTKNHGYVMASETSRYPWVKQNFSKCDADGDGKLTSEEYAACSK